MDVILIVIIPLIDKLIKFKIYKSIFVRHDQIRLITFELYLFSPHHFLDPLRRSNDHRDQTKKHFLEYFVENPYIEEKIQILNYYSHAKYVLEKLDEKK